MSTTPKTSAPRRNAMLGAGIVALSILAAPLSALADDHYAGYAWEAEMARIQNGVQPPKYVPGTHAYVPPPSDPDAPYAGQIWEAEMARVQHGIQPPPNRASTLPYVPPADPE